MEASGRIYGVAAVEVGERALPVAWGRLVSTGPDVASADATRASWAMDLETISFGRIPTQDYPLRITLRDGRTLAGEAALESTNGRVYHFESRGDWTGLDDEPFHDPT